MTALAILYHLRLGLRWALMLLAAMSFLAWTRADRSETDLDRYKSIAWGLLAGGVFLFGPAYLPGLTGHPLPKVAALSIELVAVGTMCAAMIYVVATRALMRGVSLDRVRQGMAANVFVVIAFALFCLVRG